jgi:hypothetical protein
VDYYNELIMRIRQGGRKIVALPGPF